MSLVCDARILAVPLDPQIVTAHYTITTIEIVLLRVRDEDGQEGTATLWCFGTAPAKVLVAMLDYLAPYAGRGVAELRREINFFGFRGVSVFALSAFDMALHDLQLRREGVSLAAWLGRRRASVPVYWSGLFLNQSQDSLLAEVEAGLERGYRAFKLRTGKPDLAEDVARTRAVAAALPRDATLMLDAVQSWTPEQAIAGAEALAEFEPLWLEDPLVHDDYAGLDQVVAASPIPIATGENEYLAAGFERVFESGAPYLLADLERVGGISEWRALAERARETGAVLTPHVYPHVAISLCGALDQAETWLEHVPWWDPLLTEPLTITDGAVAVPDRPGSGNDLDPAAIEHHAVTDPIPLGVS